MTPFFLLAFGYGALRWSNAMICTEWGKNRYPPPRLDGGFCIFRVRLKINCAEVKHEFQKVYRVLQPRQLLGYGMSVGYLGKWELVSCIPQP